MYKKIKGLFPLSAIRSKEIRTIDVVNTHICLY